MSDKQDSIPSFPNDNISSQNTLKPQDRQKAIEAAFAEDEEEEKEAAPEKEEIRKLYSHDFSVVIHTYNSLSRLKSNLPLLLEEISSYDDGRAEIIIVDNGSDDGTADFLKENQGKIQSIRLDKTEGICSVLNRGIKMASYPAVVVLEDDVRVKKGFARPLLEAISDDNIFAAVPCVRLESKDGIITSLFLMKFNDGAMFTEFISDGRFPEPVYLPGLLDTAFVVKKEIFEELGGFDTNYDPKFFEDLDLGYRAWKRGYKVIYCRRSVVYHADVDPFRDTYLTEEWTWLKIRNYLIFMNKNFTDEYYYDKHWVKVLDRRFRLRLGIDKDDVYLDAWKRAERLKKSIREKRRIEEKEALLKDRDLLAVFSSHPDNRLGIG